MEYELRAAKEKWEREQWEKKEKARQRLEREKKARLEAAARQQALEIAQRERRLQEAAAALAARQQEEEDSREGDGVVFRKFLRAVPCSGDGDKIKLPSSAFEELSSQNVLDKGPMFFEVSAVSRFSEVHVDHDEGDAADSGCIQGTHSGVLEFTASEGMVELPAHVWANSGISGAEEKPMVRVRYIRLPKGTYAKLQPEGFDFAHIPNHKAVLESKLRQHTTVTVGDLLRVQHGGSSYNLRVLELKPGRQVSVLETDLEVDVVPPEQVGSSVQSRLVPLTLGKPCSGVVNEGLFNYYTFVIDQKLAASVAAREVDIVIRMDVEGDGKDSDADVYVAAHPLLFPTQHQHQWSSNDLGSKLVCLTPGKAALDSGTHSIGVYGFRGLAKYKIFVEAKAVKEEKQQGQRLGADQRNAFSADAGPSSSSNFGQCGNCKQFVPVQAIALHEAYCWRHNLVCSHPGCGVVLRKEEMSQHVHCEKCHEAFRIEELEKHVKVFHEPKMCTCGAMLEMKDMVYHQSHVCPNRTITCRFCGDMVPAGTDADEDPRDKLRGLTAHESACGSRTAECASCGRAIMLKEMDLHRAAAHSSGQSQSPRRNSPPWIQPQSSLEGAPHAAAPTSGADLAPNTQRLSARSPAVECPICGESYRGTNAEQQLNLHLDSKHFSPQSRHAMDVDSAGGSIDKSDAQSFKRILSVSCPICGMAVHSERDLSSHIDMVH